MTENLVLTEATYYILLSLYSPQHGYGIMQNAELLSHGRVRLAAGTLYGALNAMVDKRWIVQLPVEDGSRKKNYQITELGLEVLRGELERLRELVNNGDMVLGGKEDGTHDDNA
ncbi:MAG: PadR family transcriptional regulator [Firmicutes bacterium]|nr:PadR family transcriptional regulator [Bacillota bacterium]